MLLIRKERNLIRNGMITLREWKLNSMKNVNDGKKLLPKNTID